MSHNARKKFFEGGTGGCSGQHLHYENTASKKEHTIEQSLRSRRRI